MTSPGRRAEASEVLWLLGMPFLVQVIGGDGDSVQEVVAGLPSSSTPKVSAGRMHAGARPSTEEPDTVIVAIWRDSPSD